MAIWSPHLFISGRIKPVLSIGKALEDLKKIYPQSSVRYLKGKSYLVEQVRIRDQKRRVRQFQGHRTLDRATAYSRKYSCKGWMCVVYIINQCVSDAMICSPIRKFIPIPEGTQEIYLPSGPKIKWERDK